MSFSLGESRGAGFTRDGAKRFGVKPEEYIVGVSGLTQAQIDQAWADPGNPPQLEGVVDGSTGEPLVWHGRTKTGRKADNIRIRRHPLIDSLRTAARWALGRAQFRAPRKRRW